MPLSEFFPELQGWEKVQAAHEPIRELPPAIPDPNSQINPFLRTTQPLILQYQGDTTKQFIRPGTSGFRNAVLAPNAQSTTQASVASTSAIVSKIVTKNNAITSAGLTMPPQYNVKNTPLTPPGGTLGVQWNPVSPGQVLQGPPPNFTAFQGASYLNLPAFLGPPTTKPFSITYTPQSQNTLVFYMENPTAGHNPALTSLGWTPYGVVGLSSQQFNSFSPVSISGTIGQQTAFNAFMFGFSGSPPVRSFTQSNVLIGGTMTLNSVVAGDTILLAFNVNDGNPGVPLTITVSDNQGNQYQLLASGTNTGTQAGAAPGGIYQGSFVFAAQSVSGGTVTTSWVIGYSGGVAPGSIGTPVMVMLDIGALPAVAGVPSFGPLNPASIPTIDISSLGGILPTKSGGTGANLGAPISGGTGPGGPGKILFESTANGPMSVAAYLTPSAQSAAFTANYQNLYLINSNTGQINVTLPTAAGVPSAAGAQIAFKKTSSDPNFVNLIAATGQTIDGGPTAQFNQQFTTLTLESDGANWWIV